jgi:trans-aconitate methyltransferase
MSEQTWTAETYARNGAFVPALGSAVVALLAPQPGERILDLGCGDGTLTETIVASGALVTGFDGSEDFVAAARAKGIDARFGDAHVLPFEGEFDAVFSNAALHWMLEPDRVIAGVARALVSHGRFVGELGGEGNVAAIFAALRETLALRELDADGRFPWYFPSAHAYAERLRAGGFTVERIESFERPTPLPTGMAAWLETFAQPFFRGMDATERSEVIADVAARLAPTRKNAAGEWSADYVRVRFIARKN